MYESDWNERERRATLHSYGLTPNDDTTSLDEIVRLTARILDKPMAFISLVEADRQWFLSRHGVEVDGAPIAMSICRLIMETPGVTVIRDTFADDRTRDNPLCHGDGGFRFYAGTPLIARNGRSLGALAVLGTEPSDLDALGIEVLESQGRQVMAQLNLRKALRRADIMRREVDHRVKNSLQSVASLTRIQARQVHSDEAREALENVGRRINTVAALNQQLYASDSDRTVQLKPFLRSIVDLIRESIADEINIDLEAQDLAIDAGMAGAIAIIVNEFTTNSAKHAFEEGQSGTVTITARLAAPGRFTLICRDDGRGLDPERMGTGLGISILDSAIDQLSGEKVLLDRPGHGIQVTCRL
ncbi:sensor histidine kinase [Palleronia sp. LCG004]|uniref:sensor histidine kinase n=1 Tax=Palleronia sp. LCG004 TaxID=3079304 RepID=UPI0029420C48|nr:histidine kinase dimerization/phosphoacceptor domain -containing protein [Palleronia sp. LCG004]WOI56746.1 histidine kinase dimerization/phosphoacceptor domain -containing protein [Palleronia sp. LCG004]